MMAQTGKLLRWLFGINAILFCAITVRYIFILLGAVGAGAVGEGAVGSIARLSGYTAMAAVYGAAFLMLKKGGRWARYLALTASVLNLPFYWVVEPAWMWSVAGAMGLVVFWRQKNVDQLSMKTVKPPRTRGDGTSSSIDVLANVALFSGFLVAGFYWANWSARQRLPNHDSLLARLLIIEVAMLFTTVAHESGHAIAALLLKMKLRRFVVGPIEGSFRSGRWQLRFRAAGFLGAPGGVGVVPSTLTDLRRRHVLVAAAGPVASLAFGLLAMGAAFSAKGHWWEAAWMPAAYAATFSLLSFAFNLIPMRPTSVYSDGARIYQLLGRSPWGDVHLALSMGSCTLASPMRPRDCDIHVLNRATAFLTKGMEALLLRVQAQTYFHDCGMVPEAVQSLQDAEAVYAESIDDLRADLHKSFVFANAFLKQDAAHARQWWERMEAKGSATMDAEYWFSRSALLWIEGDIAEADAALEQSVAMMKELPPVGAYEYDRDCVEQLRVAISVSVPRFAAAC
jgi:Peptidase M50B-like